VVDGIGSQQRRELTYSIVHARVDLRGSRRMLKAAAPWRPINRELRWALSPDTMADLGGAFPGSRNVARLRQASAPSEPPTRTTWLLLLDSAISQRAID